MTIADLAISCRLFEKHTKQKAAMMTDQLTLMGKVKVETKVQKIEVVVIFGNVNT